MVFFSLFVISAVILGAGAMLAPAWPSREPRIGLSATLLLGIVSGGAVWWAALFGWDTLIIDYLLFAIVSGVILGGTLARGGENAAWPSRKDLLFFALVALICTMPLFVLQLPWGITAPSDALITLAVRESGSFTNLAPYYPEIEGFAPPAFHALAAYLSQQLRQPIPMIHMGLGSFIALLCVWTVYDLGAEIKDKRLGYSMAIASLASFGILGLLWASFYSQLMGVLFALAFIAYALRYYRQHKWIDMIAAGLMLGAVLYTSSTLFVICLFAYYFAIFFPRRVQKPAKAISEWTKASRMGLWFGIALSCFFGVFPMVFYALKHGIWEMPYKGLVEIPTLLWIIIPTIIIFWIIERLGDSSGLKVLCGLIALLFTVPLYLFFFLVSDALYTLDFREYGTENDTSAMRWIAENTAEDSYIYNFPNYECCPIDTPIWSHFPVNFWTMSYTGRKTVFIPEHPCGFANCELDAESHRFWDSPVDSQDILYTYGIDYVLVPDGAEFPQEVEGIRLVFEQGGARVYEVIR